MPSPAPASNSWDLSRSTARDPSDGMGYLWQNQSLAVTRCDKWMALEDSAKGDVQNQMYILLEMIIGSCRRCMTFSKMVQGLWDHWRSFQCSSLSSPNLLLFIWVPPFGYAQKTGGSNTNLHATSKFCPHVSRLDWWHPTLVIPVPLLREEIWNSENASESWRTCSGLANRQTGTWQTHGKPKVVTFPWAPYWCYATTVKYQWLSLLFLVDTALWQAKVESPMFNPCSP
jgi:hypothetical protein